MFRLRIKGYNLNEYEDELYTIHRIWRGTDQVYESDYVVSIGGFITRTEAYKAATFFGSDVELWIHEEPKPFIAVCNMYKLRKKVINK